MVNLVTQSLLLQFISYVHLTGECRIKKKKTDHYDYQLYSET